MSGDALPGLCHDLPRRGEQLGQVVDRAGQPPAPPPRGRVVHAASAQLVGLRPGPAQRPFGVGQQPLGLAGSGGGQLGQLASDPDARWSASRRGRPPSGCAARRRSRGPACRLPASGPAAWCEPHPGSLDPLTRRSDPTHRLGQQPRIGRIAHVGRHHRGIGPDPVGAQQLGLGGLGQKRLVEPVHRRRPAARRELHQRGRMRHRPVQRDAAKPPPGDRVGHLPAQRLIAQPVAKLQKHQPQIGLHWRRRPPYPRIEERHERGEERRVVQQRIDASQLLGQPLQLFG